MSDKLWRLVYAVCQRIVWLVTFVAMRLFTRFSINGGEHLKNVKTPLLIVANHRSYWDAMIVGMLFPFFSNRYLPIGFMAADEYFSNPFFKIFLVLTGTYPAYKGRGLEVSLQYPRSVLQSGGVVLLFPFGKIIVSDTVRERPYRGAGMLVKEFSHLWILPIYLNTAPNLGLWDFIFGGKEMNVRIGVPFQSEPELVERDEKEITIQLTNRIMALSACQSSNNAML